MRFRSGIFSGATAIRKLRAVLDVAAAVALLAASGTLLWKMTSGPTPPDPPVTGAPSVNVEPFDGRMLLSGVSPDYIAGSSEARLVVVEFSDFRCPFCARHAKDTHPRIEEAWIARGVVRYVFRHFPLQPSGLDAAKAAHCSADQGRFWEARKALFARQAELGGADWTSILSPIGVDLERHGRCLEGLEATAAAIVLADQREGQGLGVVSTPTFFVGVDRGDGSVQLHAKIKGAQPYEAFENAVEMVTPMISSQAKG